MGHILEYSSDFIASAHRNWWIFYGLYPVLDVGCWMLDLRHLLACEQDDARWSFPAY